MPTLTPHTIIDVATLQSEFAKIREQDYGIGSRGSVKAHAVLALPVGDHTAAVVAFITALLMPGHFFRWTSLGWLRS
jgi:DNA-binding IclR family transcriptional regulator